MTRDVPNSRPRRVVLDAYWWARGTQSLRNVLHGVVEAWLAEFPTDEVTVVVPRRDVARVRDDLPDARVVGTRLWPHGLSAMLAVPWAARRIRADLLLTHNFSAFYGRGRGVLIQDLMFETNPEWFTKWELLYYRWMTRTACMADVVFSSTSTEGQRIAERSRAKHVVTAGMGMVPEIVSVDGCAERFSGVTAGNFVLAVGRLNVRKNLANTIEGCLKSGVLTPTFPLVIVGERDGAFESLPDWVRAAEASGTVVFTGFVPTAQLRWLISGCSLFVCLSLDEGFGLPPVEARIVGAAVLVSDIPVFRETLGEAAAFVDPLNVDAIATSVLALVEQGVSMPIRSAEELASRHLWSRVVRVIRGELTGRLVIPR